MRSTRPHLSRVESFQTSGSVGWKLRTPAVVGKLVTTDSCPLLALLLGVFFFAHTGRGGGGEEKVGGGWMVGDFCVEELMRFFGEVIPI